jgi:molybdate/tungstate transport system substrate-binding protein
VYVAASLVKPLQPLLDSFATRTRTVIQREGGASLVHVRKITELHRLPDLLLLADNEVFPQLLLPRYVSWYASFARNRMVVAYTARSRHANEITALNWRTIVRRSDVEVGRTDPDLAPAGYRTILLFQLAERHYREPGLARDLLAHAPLRNVRANASDLAALLATGELDYIYDYESVAAANGFSYVRLPAAIDLGDPGHASDYAAVSTRVRGASRGSSISQRGQPILYGLSIPDGAPHATAARRFLKFFLSDEARRMLRAGHVDMLDEPIVAGTGAPPELRAPALR